MELLDEDNRREGFFEEDQYRAVLRHSNELLRDFLVLAYHAGWRKGSILTLTWPQVDFNIGVIRLIGKETKNKKSTVLPMLPFPELRSMLEARHRLTKEIEKRRQMIIPYVFHRDGKRVRSIRTAWDEARTRAGIPDRLIHDFRRTAVRRRKNSDFRSPRLWIWSVSKPARSSIDMTSLSRRTYSARQSRSLNAWAPSGVSCGCFDRETQK